jgi:hypothetical protein
VEKFITLLERKGKEKENRWSARYDVVLLLSKAIGDLEARSDFPCNY